MESSSPDTHATGPNPNPDRVRRGTRRARLTRQRRLGVVAVCATVAAALGAILWVTAPPRPDPAWQHVASVNRAASPRSARAANAASRPNFRFSIVPGGVHSTDEITLSMWRDPVVAAHYAGFDATRFRVEVLPSPLTVHVSYRIGTHVYWTRKKLVLKAGEQVLTDGTNMIRVRCGNRVSLEALGPEAAEEPAPEEFEALGDPVILAALPSEASAPSPPGPPTVDGPPPTGGLYFGPRTPPPAILVTPKKTTTEDPDPTADPTPDPPTTPDPTPEPVPEPSTLVLVALGAGAGYLARKRRLSRQA